MVMFMNSNRNVCFSELRLCRSHLLDLLTDPNSELQEMEDEFKKYLALFYGQLLELSKFALAPCPLFLRVVQALFHKAAQEKAPTGVHSEQASIVMDMCASVFIFVFISLVS